MARTRKLWLGLAMLAVGGAVAILWAVRPSGDPDFLWIGPKTKGVRTMLAALEEPIDPAEFRDVLLGYDPIDPAEPPVPVKVKNALEWLGEKAEARGKTFVVLLNVDALKGDNREAEPFEIELRYPTEIGPLTVKDFLRLTFAQSGRRDIVFILRQQDFIEVTTIQNAESQRARYFAFNRVGPFDRIRQICAESFGSDGHLPHSPVGVK